MPPIKTRRKHTAKENKTRGIRAKVTASKAASHNIDRRLKKGTSLQKWAAEYEK